MKVISLDEKRKEKRTYKDALKQQKKSKNNYNKGYEEMLEFYDFLLDSSEKFIAVYDETGLKALMVLFSDMLARVALYSDDNNYPNTGIKDCNKTLKQKYKEFIDERG